MSPRKNACVGLGTMCRFAPRKGAAIECRLGIRTAQIYMRLAKHEEQLKQLVLEGYFERPKYFRSGGGWSFLDGISLPSTLI
jgi:hypothetical protein